jgi:hypothetical protein
MSAPTPTVAVEQKPPAGVLIPAARSRLLGGCKIRQAGSAQIPVFARQAGGQRRAAWDRHRQYACPPRQDAHLTARPGAGQGGPGRTRVIYILIGWVAILVALGQSSRQADQQGALQLLAGKPYGLVSLWLLGIGFAGYALWRLSAAFGVTGAGNGAGPRLKSLVRALAYAGFAYLTFKVISGTQGSQTRQQQDLTAQVMRHGSDGRWLVGIAGLIIVIVGAALVVEGIRRKFLKYLQTAQMSARTRRIVERLGVIGTAARGVVFALAGALVVEAAVRYKPSKAGGIDKALLTLRNQPFGEYLLILAALGLIVFGIYGLCEARWRKV